MKLRVVLAAVAVALGCVAVTPSPAFAADQAPSGCTIIRQLGATAYGSYGGETAVSVKQYYGTCNGAPRNWAYVWVWDQFKARGLSYQMKATITVGGVAQGWGANKSSPAQWMVSKPVATTTECTRAFGGFDITSGSGGTVTATTDQVC